MKLKLGIHPSLLLFSLAILSAQVACLPMYEGALISNWLTHFTSWIRALLTPCLISTSADQPPYWTNEIGKQWLMFRGQRFMDITAHQNLGSLSTQAQSISGGSFPSNVTYSSELDGVFRSISQAGPRADLAKFTSFRTRYYRSQTGRESQAWLLSRVRSLAQRDDITVHEFKHPWGQNSIILRIQGANDPNGPLTILGAHQDSTNLLPFLPAPGADDDGSGTVTILEALRVLLLSGWKPISPVEFHWYSAEEGGLLGSQAVAAQYEKDHTIVKAMLQQDMTAFVKQGTQEVVGIVTDFVNTDLAQFLKVLVHAYLDIPYVETKIGYAASDHASWSKIGAPSAFAIEATFENSNLRRIHTTSDVYDIPEYSFPHLLRFVRLSAAFAVELGGWA